jgi:excisionase family DNA binding protein
MENTNLLTVPEFAKALGFSVKTVRQYVWLRKFSFVRIGKAIRFEQSTVDRIIAEGRVDALPYEANHLKADPLSSK